MALLLQWARVLKTNHNRHCVLIIHMLDIHSIIYYTKTTEPKIPQFQPHDNKCKQIHYTSILILIKTNEQKQDIAVGHQPVSFNFDMDSASKFTHTHTHIVSTTKISTESNQRKQVVEGKREKERGREGGTYNNNQHNIAHVRWRNMWNKQYEMECELVNQTMIISGDIHLPYTTNDWIFIVNVSNPPPLLGVFLEGGGDNTCPSTPLTKPP